jgi:hypothetical protein
LPEEIQSMEIATQLSLPLFVPPTFDELLQQLGTSGSVEVSVNPRLRRGWQVRVRTFSGKRKLTIPRHLENAPREIKEALIQWALLPCRPRRAQKKTVRERRSILEKTIWGYVEALPDAPVRKSRFNASAFAGKTQGVRYDLREVFDAVNAACFNARLTAWVRWGTRTSKTSYHTAKTDRNGNRVNCITIAGAYNHKDIPRFAIEGIMHHEMLHIAVPPYKKNGRMVIHGKEFKSAERKFRHYKEWREWERASLGLIMRKLRRMF